MNNINLKQHASDLPFFTVIIPVHNKKPHVKRSINSVLNQDFSNLELIIVDDASTDGSLDEIRQFSDSRIRVLQRDVPGPGGYAARNLGVGEARADWIAFLDSDDEWYSDHLLHFASLIPKYPSAKIFGCGCLIVNPKDNGTLISQKDNFFLMNSSGGSRLLSFDEYLQNEIMGMRPLNSSTACVHRSTLINAGGFPEGKTRRGGDVDTWLRCVASEMSIAWSAHIGGIYYRDSINMVTKTEKFLVRCERETVLKLLPYYPRKTKILLLRFSNRRAITAWKESGGKFSLLKNLFFTAEPLKACRWAILSLLPFSVYERLRLFKKKHISNKRFSW